MRNLQTVKQNRRNQIQFWRSIQNSRTQQILCDDHSNLHLQQFYGAMIGVGTYYAKYILADENMFGTFAWFINIPLIIALIFTPTIVQNGTECIS